MPRLVRIEAPAAPGPELTAAVRRLLPQLTGQPAGPDVLVAALADPAVTVLAAREGGAIVGVALVAVYRKLSGVEARLEDVVVDEPARGAGAGSALVEAAIELARARGATHLELTTSPRREAANRLYERLGLRRRETNVYRIDLVP